MNFERFCKDNEIPIATETDSHYTSGWTNINCPHCDDHSFHCGIPVDGRTVNCYRCGTHSIIETIETLLKCTRGEAHQIIRQYDKSKPIIRPTIEKKFTKISLPPEAEPMTVMHWTYLVGRKFDPTKLEPLWNLMGTSHLGEYRFRIIAPVFFKGALVSFQGRDITNKIPDKYKSCRGTYIKDYLYGLDFVKGDSIVICEGITDVWRLGKGAVATFGTQFTLSQVNQLRQFSNRYILFDSEDEQAVEQANKLANQLSAFSGNTEVITIDCTDPAEMKQQDADVLMRKLLN